jgi:hypothetical protein
MILDVFVDTHMVCSESKMLVYVPTAFCAWNCRSSQVFIVICVELKQNQCCLIRQKTSFHTFATPRQGKTGIV